MKLWLCSLVLAATGCHNAASGSRDGSSPGDGAEVRDGAPSTADGSSSAGDGFVFSSDGSVVPVVDAGQDATVGTATDRSVLLRGNDIYRHGTYTQPTFTKGAVTTLTASATFDTNATFPANGNTQGQGMASVLYVEKGPASAGCPAGVTGCAATGRAAGDGIFLAFPPLGSNPNIIAFDETTGLYVWTAHVTAGSDGIRGTPAIDPVTRRIFVVTGNNPHMVRAVSVDTGAEITTGGWPLRLASDTLSYNNNTFASQLENQHGALLLLNDILYIPFGGENGDVGAYYGWMVAVDITDPAKYAGWATQSVKSGIWGTGGPASDGTYVFATTGNTGGAPRSASDSEELVRWKGLAEFTRDANSIFVPTEWATWDSNDLDFASGTPAFISLPAGSSPPSVIVAPGKGGRVFVVDAQNFSSGSYPTPGGQLLDLVVSGTTQNSIYTSPTVYSTPSGIHATINVGGSNSANAVSCPPGTQASSEEYVSLLFSPGKTPIAATSWCASNGGQGGGTSNHPPMSTTSDGTNDPIVWFTDNGQLTGVDGETGAHLVTTSGTSCDSLFSMSFPIAVKGRVVVAALGHLCAWSLDGQ